MEQISPSVWRKASRNTARKVSAVLIARDEYRGCPPRVVQGSAGQAAIAASVNHMARLPRPRRTALYSAQFVLRNVLAAVSVDLDRQAALSRGTTGRPFGN